MSLSFTLRGDIKLVGYPVIPLFRHALQPRAGRSGRRYLRISLALIVAMPRSGPRRRPTRPTDGKAQKTYQATREVLHERKIGWALEASRSRHAGWAAVEGNLKKLLARATSCIRKNSLELNGHVDRLRTASGGGHPHKR